MKIKKLLSAGVKGAAGVSCGVGALVAAPLVIGGPIGFIPTIGMAATGGILIKQAFVEIKEAFYG